MRKRYGATGSSLATGGLVNKHALEAKLAESARLAAHNDLRHGDHNSALNVMTLLAWAGRTKLEHADCHFEVVRHVTKGYLMGVECDTHGFIEAPAWRSRS